MARTRAAVTAGAACLAMLAGCGGSDEPAPAGVPSAVERAAGSDAEETAETAERQRHPDILSATLIARDDGTYDVEVTVSSPYDTPQRYADGWRVLAPDGSDLGSHTLLHDHAGEQPFTRTQRGLAIPDVVTEVTVEGRDLEHGYGGGTVVVAVPAA